MTRNELKELTELTNKYREQLAQYDVNADELNIRILRTIDKIINALANIKQRKEEAERILNTSGFTISEVAREAGLDRSNLCDNELYRKIIQSGTATRREQNSEKEIAFLKRRLKEETDNIAEYERREKLNLNYEVELGNMSYQLEEANRQVQLLQKNLTRANQKIEELQAQLYQSQKTLVLPQNNTAS